MKEAAAPQGGTERGSGITIEIPGQFTKRSRMRRRTLDGWADHVANGNAEPRVAFGFVTGFT